MGRGICEDRSCGFYIENDLGTTTQISPDMNLRVPGKGRSFHCLNGSCLHSQDLKTVFESLPSSSTLLVVDTETLPLQDLDTEEEIIIVLGSGKKTHSNGLLGN